MNTAPRILLTAKQGDRLPLDAHGSLPPMAHIFEGDSILAVNAAHAAGRPLLVRGEPGTGKSQLARAVAKRLNRALITKVLDVHTEVRELFYTFDAVARLAEAQLMAALGERASDELVHQRLDERRYLRPGPLWWAFDWRDAKRQCALCFEGRVAHEPEKGARGGADERVVDPEEPGSADSSKSAIEPEQRDGGDPKNGCVVLLDEIDKTDASVPNGLLEALGSGAFDTPCAGKVTMKPGVDPLVIITTNEERELPDAFLRRCVVLQLALPNDEAKLVAWLVERGAAHFEKLGVKVLTIAAKQLAEDRVQVRKKGLSAPGQAEYLDLLRTLHHMCPGDERGQLDLLRRASRFILKKHPAETPA